MNIVLSNAIPIGVYKMQIADCTPTGGVGLSLLDRLIFLHSWWESNETFLGVASVISRQATCQVSTAGEHFFCVSMEVVLSWKLLFNTRAWFVSILYSATITCFVFPLLIGLCSYKKVPVIWEHSRKNSRLPKLFLFEHFFFVLSAILNS